MSRIPLVYIPTKHDQSNWGYELDRLWSSHFIGKKGSPHFWADSNLVPSKTPFSYPSCIVGNTKISQAFPNGIDISNDVALVHSILLPGEVDWEGVIEHRTDLEVVIQEEFEFLKSFGVIFTLSNYFKDILEARGLEVAGVLKYPIIPNYEYAYSYPHPEIPRVVVNQRMSEEKYPLMVMQVAEMMPEVQFVFTGSKPLHPKYKGWLLSIPSKNVSYKICPTKDDLRRIIRESSCAFLVTGRDNFGVSGLEVLSQGRPYVAPNAFAFPEYIPSEFLYTPYSLEDMVECVYHAIEIGISRAPWDLKESIQSLRAILSVYKGD